MHCRAFTRPLPRVRDPLRKKREKENSPTSQSFRTSSAVSVCVTPPLPSTLRWMQPTSSLGVLPTSSSGLLPSSPPTILHTLAILKKLIYISFLRPPLCSVLGCLSSAASRHLRLLPISVLLSFVVPRSRHSAPTSLIESSLRARVITPPLLSPDRSSFLCFCSGEFFLVSRDRHPAISLTPREHDHLLTMPRSARSLCACRSCSSLLCLGLTHIH